MAGRGTTLYEAAVYGYDAYGIEIEPNSVHETTVFFKKFLEEERLKHSYSKRQIYGKGKGDSIVMEEFEYSRDKKEFGNIKNRKKFGIIHGNSGDAFNYFKKERFHLIVGDLPYGIHHGNRPGKKQQSRNPASLNIAPSRNPSELIESSLEGWKKALYKGGIAVLAWNSFLASRKKLAGIFSDHGFEVLSDSPYDGFEHMVDRSIKRDIIVARKK